MQGSIDFVVLLFSVIVSLSSQVLGACDVTKCKLPDCFCPSNTGPQSVPQNETVQMVVFTFDDAINEQNDKYYNKLFADDRRNPNGCPIRATFFVSHKWTDYKKVNDFYRKGHEMGSHSITHKLPKEWWSMTATYKDWNYEIQGQRKNLNKEGNIPLEHIRGMRVPFLQLGHDNQYKMLKDNKFLYDSSFMVGPYTDRDPKKPIWPFTLDYPPPVQYCDNSHCPKKSYPGLWEFPLNRWIGLNGQACPMADACLEATTKEDVLKYLWKNFNRHYDNHRVPLGINFHAVWFDKNKVNFEGMDTFVQELLKRDDVYFVTVQQMLAWMRQPTPLTDLKDFQPWRTACTGGTGTSAGVSTSGSTWLLLFSALCASLLTTLTGSFK